jgi:hypothetical protein
MKARQIIEEAVDPKSFLKQAGEKVLMPGEDYYLAIDSKPIVSGVIRMTHRTPGALKLGQVKNDNAEYCPMRVNADGSFEQLDGMYGLTDDIWKHFGITDDQQYSLAGELDAEVAFQHYSNQFYSGLRSGQLQGVADGILGKRYWALVYWPNDWQQGRMGGTRAEPRGPVLAQFGVRPPYLTT